MITPARRTAGRAPEIVASLATIATLAVGAVIVLAFLLLQQEAELDQLQSDVQTACAGPAARLDLTEFVPLCLSVR